ncbi:hypothetical protein [Shewanella colwelliana]|uniref:hypothetical protein n=1 Tax=Shewanella colwelliana TaxID=23 RepID=UPI003735D248
MQHYHFIQSNHRLRNLHFTGQLIAQCEVEFENLPYTASLYRVQGEPVRFVGVMEIKPLEQLEAVQFEEISTDEMETFFGPEAAFVLFQAAQMEGYQYVGNIEKNREANK